MTRVHDRNRKALQIYFIYKYFVLFFFVIFLPNCLQELYYRYKKQKKAMLKDSKEVNRVLKKVHEKESKVIFKRIGDKKDLCIIGVCDASYHCNDKSVAGEMVMLGNKNTTEASPLCWK